MAVKDFQADQIRVSKLIVSGGKNDQPALQIYSASHASNFVGDVSDGKMLDNVGRDVFLFVSGTKTISSASVSGHPRRKDVTLFGGDIVVSGTLFAERMIVEVDESVTGSLWVSGSLIVSQSAEIFEGLSVNLYRGTTSESFFNVYGESKTGIKFDPSKNQVLILSGSETRQAAGGSDVAFYVSGAVGSRGRSDLRGLSLFGGDVFVSGTIHALTSSGLDGWVDDGAVVRLSSSTDSVGIGTTSPDFALEVASDASSGAEVGVTQYRTSATDGSNLYLRHARGTEASPSVLSDDDVMGCIDFYGYGDSGFVHGARICTYIDGTPGDGDMPTRIVLKTAPDGSSTPSERMRITSAGLVGIAASAPKADLQIGNGTANVAILIDADGAKSGSLSFTKDSASVQAELVLDSNEDFVLVNSGSDKNIIVKANDGGTLTILGIISSSLPSTAWGTSNYARATNATIGGGTLNRIESSNARVADTTYAVIAGGNENTIKGSSRGAFIGGGLMNNITGTNRAAAGTSSEFATIAGGHANDITDGYFATLVGGYDNDILAGSSYGFLGGGRENRLTSQYGAILGGSGSIVTGEASFAIGMNLSVPTSDTIAIGGGVPETPYTVVLSGSKIVLSSSDLVLINSGGAKTSPDPALFNDTTFYISGAIGSRGTSRKGTSVFGGDTFISGTLVVSGGVSDKGSWGTISGSIFETATGLPYLNEGLNITITSASNGQITIASSAPSSTGLGSSVFTDGGQKAKSSGSISIDASNAYADTYGSDIFLFVSGVRGGKQTHASGTAVFAGDIITSGNAYFGLDSMNRFFGSDVVFYVSGGIGSHNRAITSGSSAGPGTAVFGGDTLVSGGLWVEGGTGIRTEGNIYSSGSAVFASVFDMIPAVDNTYNLGSASFRWANVYTGDLHLKNDKGDWTIAEEEDMLVVVNNKSGKRFKMMLEELED